MSPFLLFPRPGSRLIPLFFVPKVVIKVKVTRGFVFPYLVPVVGVNARGTTELGKLWLWRAWQWSVRLTVSPWL